MNCKHIIPSSSVLCVRKTAALFCITRCMFRRIWEVGREPFEFLNLSNHSIVFSPASLGKGFWFSPAGYQKIISMLMILKCLANRIQAVRSKYFFTSQLAWFSGFRNSVSTSSTKNNNVKKRIGTKTVSTMN